MMTLLNADIARLERIYIELTSKTSLTDLDRDALANVPVPWRFAEALIRRLLLETSRKACVYLFFLPYLKTLMDAAPDKALRDLSQDDTALSSIVKLDTEGHVKTTVSPLQTTPPALPSVPMVTMSELAQMSNAVYVSHEELSELLPDGWEAYGNGSGQREETALG